MTNKEAIDELIIVRNVYDGMREAYKPCVEAIDMAISALQAQDLQPTCNQLATDCVSKQAAIDAMCAVCGNDCDKSEFVYNAPQDEQVILCPEHYALTQLPSAQPDLCDGCEWEYAFGYGECHHCKRHYNDMYEVKDEG